MGNRRGFRSLLCRRLPPFVLAKLARVPASIAIALLGVSVSGSAEAGPLPIEVCAIGNCPSKEAVSAELERIAAVSDRTWSRHGRADVFESTQGVRVRLSGLSGGVDGERAVETGADCGERAIAAAVVIASWQSALSSEVDLDLTAIRTGPGATPAWFPSVGVAGVGTTGGAGGWAWGAALDFQVAHRGGWGGRIAAWGTSYRSQALGNDSGRASWTRWALGIGPAYQLDRDWLVLAVSAQLAVAIIAVKGEDFAVTREDAGVDVGARLGIEMGFRRAAFVPCVGIGVVVWPRSHRVLALGIDDEKTLPKLDLLLTAGVRWRRGP
jgi:hypothetical protein